MIFDTLIDQMKFLGHLSIDRVPARRYYGGPVLWRIQFSQQRHSKLTQVHTGSLLAHIPR